MTDKGWDAWNITHPGIGGLPPDERPPAPPPPPDKPKKQKYPAAPVVAKPTPAQKFEQFNVSGGGGASAQGAAGGGLGATGTRTQRWTFTGNVNITFDPVLRWETYTITLPPKITGEPSCFENLDISDMAEQGYYRCTFRLNGPREFLQEMFFNGLGRHIQVASPEGQIVWEGKLFEMTLNVRAIQAVNSLKDEYNSVWARYRITGASTTNDSTAQTDTPSRARYGNRDYVLSAGELDVSGNADQICQRVLQWQRKPKPTLIPASSAQAEPYIDVTCIGYADTLSWQVYNQTGNTGSEAASSLISDVITAKGQYVASSQLSANSTSVPKVYNVDRDAGGIVLDVARLGDSAYNRWLLRTMTDRILTYAAAATPNLLAATTGGGGLPAASGVVGAGNVTATSCSVTPGAGANQLLIAWYVDDSETHHYAPKVTGCVANGSLPLTHVPGIPVGGYVCQVSSYKIIDAWYLIAPPIGVLVTCQFSGNYLNSDNNTGCACFTYLNVNQTNPFGGNAVMTYSSTAIALTVTPASQVGWLAVDGTTAQTNPTAGQTKRSPVPNNFTGTSDKAATAVTTTMSWSSNQANCALISFCLQSPPSTGVPVIAYKFDIWHPDHAILDANGGIIAPWSVRSNNWIQIVGAGLPSVLATTSFVDDPTLFYIEKAEWKDGQDIPVITNNRGQLLDVIVARIAARSSV